jgi:hypothetical protein
MAQKKPKSKHMSIRVPAELADFVDVIATQTGWNDTKSLLWLADQTRRLMKDKAMDRDRVLNEHAAWVRKHAVELQAARALKDAAANVKAIVNGNLVDGIKILRGQKKLQEKTA